ncbi:sre G protein-coupled chemoreceptor domain-containing protein [Ditylenchus destructor]|nr:sre G protein-coupled chemoreceptor domain-containing protein [Ditylenchus destructor]
MVTLVEFVINGFSCAISSLNIFLCVLMMFNHMKSTKKYHLNYVILRGNFIVACHSIAICRFLNSLTSIGIWMNAFQISDTITTWINTFEMASSHLLRTTFIGITTERLIATAYNSTYEQGSHFRFFSFLIIPVVYLAAWALTIAFYHAHISFTAMSLIAASFDLTNSVGLALLRYSNKRLRKITFGSNIRLPQRYQITENLKVLNSVQFVIFLGTVSFLFASISVVIIYNCVIADNTLFNAYFYTTMNVYVAIASISILTSKSHSMRRSFLCCGIFGSCNQPSDIGPMDHPSSQYVVSENYKESHSYELRRQFELTNVFGQRIASRYSIDGHFEMLRRSWEA